MDTEIYHCVFTHAKDGRSGTGGRITQVEHDASELLETEAYQELRALVEKLQAESVREPAFVMRRFSAGAKRFACFVASYGKFEDASGRDGWLNHARVVQLEPDAVWFDPLPLVSLAEAFPIDAVRAADPIDRLQAYIERIRNEVVIIVPLSRQALQAVPREHLKEVLLAVLGALGDSRKRHRVRAPEIPLTQLARAWAALPVGLQRQSAWAFAAKEGLPVPLTWSMKADPDKPSAGSTRAAEQYLALLLDSTQDVTKLVRDETLDLGGFAQHLQRAETMDMSTKKTQKPDPRPDPRPLDGNSVVDLNRQYDRMFAALKEYVDLRLDGHDAARAAARSGRGGEVVPASGTDWKQILRRYGAALGLLAGILLTLGVLAWTGKLQFRTRSAAAPAQQESPETASVQEEPEEDPAPLFAPAASDNLRKLVSDAAVSKKWPEAFLQLTTSEPETVAALIEKTMQHDAIAPAARRQLADLQDRLRGRGAKLESTDRAVLRDYLMQYIATQVTTERIVIDDKLTDLVPAVMNRLRDETNATSEATQPSNDELQGEIILRWLEKHPS